MTEILTALFENTLEITLSMSVMISLVLIFSAMYSSKFRAGCRYTVWILIAARLLIPLNIHYSEPLIHIDESPKTDTRQDIGYRESLNNIVTIKQSDYTDDTGIVQHDKNGSSGFISDDYDNKPNIKLIAAAVWITVAALSFLHTLCGYFRLRYKLSRWSRPASEHVFDMLEIKRAEYKINKILHVYVSDVASSPMLCGFFRPTIVLPPYELDDERLNAALIHELVHLRRCDLWIKLILGAALSLHWFNPLVHIMCSCAAQDIEFSCDEEVLEGCGDRERRIYADALLIFIKSERAHKLPLTTQFDTRRKPILRRFERILSETPRLPGTLLVIIAAFFIVIAASFIEIGGIRDFAELPDDRYFMTNGIIYSTSDDTPRGYVTAAYEYRRRRYVPLEKKSRRITAEADGISTEYGYSYYISSSGKVIKSSNNTLTMSSHCTYPPAVSKEPTLYGTTEENQVITYLSGDTLNALHIAGGIGITTPDAVFIDGEIKIHCKPLSYSPDGNKMLYLAGCRSYSSLYLYDFESSSSVMICPDLTSYVMPDSYNFGSFSFMDSKRILVMPFSPEVNIHTGFVYDIDTGRSITLESYAQLEADRYTFVYGTPYMLHLYDGNIMLGNTRTAVYLDPAVPISLSRNIAYSGAARSGDYIWFADTDCAHIFRVRTDGPGMGDSDHIAYKMPSNVREVQPVGMISDDLLLVCERLGDSSWRCITLDFGDSVPITIPQTSSDISETTGVTSVLVSETKTPETAGKPTSKPPFSPQTSGTRPDEPHEVSPDYVPSYAELGNGRLFAIVRSPNGDKLHGSGVPEQFSADMNEGKHSAFDMIIYSERVIDDKVYYIADLWYELIYDGTRAVYISYSYTNTPGEADFKLTAKGPIPFSSMEMLTTTDGSGNYFREYYFNEASDRRCSELMLRYSIPESEVQRPEKAQPLYPDENGYPLEWYTCRRYDDWVNAGTDIEGLKQFLAGCEADESCNAVFGQLIKRIKTELENAGEQ